MSRSPDKRRERSSPFPAKRSRDRTWTIASGYYCRQSSAFPIVHAVTVTPSSRMPTSESSYRSPPKSLHPPPIDTRKHHPSHAPTLHSLHPTPPQSLHISRRIPARPPPQIPSHPARLDPKHPIPSKSTHPGPKTPENTHPH
ncbi:hypothetical protein CCMSSC00406_0001716 [Pleurotus cornucopiae]|uniref:Uncharacterized protein n=1 Tax=Pleurotus cornucopiae TaxID=5321 RepID=A0ACB7IQH6_PLECO|nr:hypothetical protein CCMSSC00406_0001716 [Pleurotus cornucopiae]